MSLYFQQNVQTKQKAHINDNNNKEIQNAGKWRKLSFLAGKLQNLPAGGGPEAGYIF